MGYGEQDLRILEGATATELSFIEELHEDDEEDGRKYYTLIVTGQTQNLENRLALSLLTILNPACNVTCSLPHASAIPPAFPGRCPRTPAQNSKTR